MAMDLYFSATKTTTTEIKADKRLSNYGARILDIEQNLPTPIYKFVDVEGSDELLDFTEHEGEVKYKNDRKVVITFDVQEKLDSQLNLTTLIKLVHGKRFYFVMGDFNKPYKGRFRISKAKRQNYLYSTYTLEITFLSYKTVTGVM